MEFVVTKKKIKKTKTQQGKSINSNTGTLSIYWVFTKVEVGWGDMSQPHYIHLHCILFCFNFYYPRGKYLLSV